jgi:hypothetical protein
LKLSSVSLSRVADTTPAPEETPKEEQAPETPVDEKKEIAAEEAPKKSIFAMMCGCLGGKAPSAEQSPVEEKKEEDTKEKEEEEVEKPAGENAEAAA